jgi:hypothetical protein
MHALHLRLVNEAKSRQRPSAERSCAGCALRMGA